MSMSSFLIANKKQPANAGWIWFEVHVGQNSNIDNKLPMVYNTDL